MKVFFKNWRNHVNTVPSFTPNLDLNREFWGRDDALDPEVRRKLIAIAEDFMESADISAPIKDITFTGSLANYNFSKHSDIDLHIIVSFDDIDENTDLVKDFFDNKRMLWNLTHKIMINDHEVEIYIQDTADVHISSGVYSILEDKWIVKPQREDPEIDYENIKKKVYSFTKEIDKLERNEVSDLQEKLKRINKLKEKIRKFRKAGLDKAGEYSSENLAFKVMRMNGYLKKLSDLKKSTYDEMMSLEEQL